MQLLRVLLSDMSYRKVLTIIGADQALADSGTPYACGRDAYTRAIFGEPGIDKLWMVQFAGHHLALNIIMLGEHGVLAPVMTAIGTPLNTRSLQTSRFCRVCTRTAARSRC